MYTVVKIPLQMWQEALDDLTRDLRASILHVSKGFSLSKVS